MYVQYMTLYMSLAFSIASRTYMLTQLESLSRATDMTNCELKHLAAVVATEKFLVVRCDCKSDTAPGPENKVPTTCNSSIVLEVK